MLSLSLGRAPDAPLHLLCLGAHSDDIEIGCGGTVLDLLARRPGCRVTWVVFAAPGERAGEAERSAAAFLAKAAARDVRTLRFRESFLPYDGAELKTAFEALKSVAPDLVLTHTRDDLHQDHRIVSELTWNTFRDHVVLEYEIPKWDGDLGRPNTFVPLSEEVCREKLRLLETHFATQRARDWFDARVFMGLLRMRGMECRSPSGYAEAFHARKLVLA